MAKVMFTAESDAWRNGAREILCGECVRNDYLLDSVRERIRASADPGAVTDTGTVLSVFIGVARLKAGDERIPKQVIHHPAQPCMNCDRCTECHMPQGSAVELLEGHRKWCSLDDSAPYRVAAGVRTLDEWIPDWRDRVSREHVSVAEQALCILGQIGASLITDGGGVGGTQLNRLWDVHEDSYAALSDWLFLDGDEVEQMITLAGSDRDDQSVTDRLDEMSERVARNAFECGFMFNTWPKRRDADIRALNDAWRDVLL